MGVGCGGNSSTDCLSHPRSKGGKIVSNSRAQTNRISLTRARPLVEMSQYAWCTKLHSQTSPVLIIVASKSCGENGKNRNRRHVLGVWQRVSYFVDLNLKSFNDERTILHVVSTISNHSEHTVGTCTCFSVVTPNSHVVSRVCRTSHSCGQASLG
jgi:hypothetical protein